MSWALEIAGTVYDHCKTLMFDDALKKQKRYGCSIWSDVTWIMLQPTVYALIYIISMEN